MNFDLIMMPVAYILKFFNKIVGNHYILALLIFAVLVELVLIPFGIKQQKNSIKQAALRPKEKAIRDKYAGRDDQPTKQKMQEEIQALYQKEGYNPMSGCLPMLIQFPVIILLYNIVINPLKYVCGLSEEAINAAAEVVKVLRPELAEKALSTSGNTINLMSYISEIGIDKFLDIPGFTADMVMPKLSYFGVNLGLNPSFTPTDKLQYWLLLVPVLTFVVYFFSQKLNRKLSYQPAVDDAQMGCSNKMMDIMMPLFSVYITFITPAAIGIYWMFKSILGVLKQWILKKAMPIPEFSEEDYKAAVKEINARQDKSTTVKKSGKVVRSLHHIDDEDYEDTREKALKHKEALAAQEAEEAAAKAEAPTLSSLFGKSAVKKDDKKDKKSKKDKETTEESADEVGPEGKRQ
ncbi:MAG: YidC/Oxa1 family membrane protein insertase [Clostridia bacterium]|nr:YidC/Oxa1 family membrane protein insertase [Clostridia bacterium]